MLFLVSNIFMFVLTVVHRHELASREANSQHAGPAVDSRQPSAAGETAGRSETHVLQRCQVSLRLMFSSDVK